MNASFYERLLSAIKNKQLTIVSFDFFDTLMSRRTSLPTDVFWILGNKLSEKKLISTSIFPARFHELRIKAEQIARENSPTPEINIKNIYENFPTGFFSCTLDEIINEEIETEKELLFPIKQAIEAINLSYKRGHKIIVVSDTYFDSTQLKYFWGDNTPNIEIEFFVSSEYKTGKYDKLFDAVIKKLKIQPFSMLHSGDNYHSDIVAPNSKGIATCFLPHGSSLFWDIFHRETKFQTCVSDRTHAQIGDIGVTSLRCKVLCDAGTETIDRANYFQYGAQILGPVLSPFVNWVKATADSEQIELIIPLMREGYLIDKLLHSYPEIHSHPAYLSRRIMFQAGLTNATRTDLESLRFGNLDSTATEYLDLIGIDVADIPSLENQAAQSISDDHIFSTLLDSILNSPHLIEKIRSTARNIRRGIISHLKQLLMVNGRPVKKVAIVDVGWNGTIQRLLSDILAEERLDISLIGLYMMTTPAVNDLFFKGVIAKGYFIDGGFPKRDFSALSRTLEIFEQSCSPSHGSVSHHEIKTGAPVLLPDQIPSKQRGDIEDIQDGILSFNRMYRLHISESVSASTLVNIGGLVRTILRRAMLNPTPEEAKLFSDWVHDDNLASGGATPIMGTSNTAAFIRYKTIAQLFATPMSELYWPAAALVINNPDRTDHLAFMTKSESPLEQFEENIGFSSEMASGTIGEASRNDLVKSHQTILKNGAGYSYLRFEVLVDDKSYLRWTPITNSFQLKVDFVSFSFRGQNGHLSQFRADGASTFSKISVMRGMENHGAGKWRGPGEGSAFYFNNLRSLGVTGRGKLTVEIACKIQTTDYKHTSQREFKFSQLGSPAITAKVGYGAIESFNGTLPKDSRLLYSETGRIDIFGWMVNPHSTETTGCFFLRLTNFIGETIFIPLDTVERPDIASHLKNPCHAMCGYSLSGKTIPAGEYLAAIISQNGIELTLSKDPFKIKVAQECIEHIGHDNHSNKAGLAKL